MFIFRILRFLGLSEFPPLEFVHITTPIGATYLRQRHTQMKSAEPSIRMSKRSQGEASITAPASDAMPPAEETFVDPTTAVDLTSGGVDEVDPTVAPPFSLCAMMQSFMTTQAAHGQLFDELLMKVASLRADFMEYRSAFPPPPPFED